jgi:CRISPR/Cas system-associated endoribonuclease Cas2
MKTKTIHQEIRDYIRINRHLTDDIVAEKFNVSVRTVAANKAHITMGTDTDNPQARSKAVKRTIKKGLTLIKTSSYELRINEDGQFSRLDLNGRKISRVTDIEAKAIMVTELMTR